MRKSLWMFAAILICGAMTVLTSCSANDNPVENNNKPANGKLSGMYGILLEDEKGTIGDNAYNLVALTYDFYEDGTGLWYEMYFTDKDSDPFSGNGGEAGGQFKYTVGDDGKVSFIFDRPEYAPQRGTVTFLEEGTILFHHTGKNTDYLGELLDKDIAINIHIFMLQTIGGESNEASTEPAATGHELATSVVGEIVGSDGKAYALADKGKLPKGVTRAGMVAYKDGSHGLILSTSEKVRDRVKWWIDKGLMNWYNAMGEKGVAGHKPTIEGYKWKLPSRPEWEQMITANGGDVANPTGLHKAMKATGGTPIQEACFYWTTTEAGSDSVWLLAVYSTRCYFAADTKYNNRVRTRACIAF